MTEREQRHFRQHGGHFVVFFLYAGNKSRTRTAFTKHPEDRTAAVKALAEKAGCRFEALYYSFGESDGIIIVEAPDEGTVTVAAGQSSILSGRERSASAPAEENRSSCCSYMRP
jgi:uncharacterized protein with GYD domain